MHAYDYESQQWIEGPEADRLAKRQIEEELELLEGPRGMDYRNYTKLPGDTRPLEEVIRELKVALWYWND